MRIGARSHAHLVGANDAGVHNGSLCATVPTVCPVYHFANGISREMDKARVTLAQAETTIIRLSRKVGAPFTQVGDMVEKNAELLQLEDELRNDGKQNNMPVIDQADGNITLDCQAPPRSTLLPQPRKRPSAPRRRSGTRVAICACRE